MIREMHYALYRPREARNGLGTFYWVECCKMFQYSVNGYEAKHGKLCPACLQRRPIRYTTLIMAGTEEAEKLGLE